MYLILEATNYYYLSIYLGVDSRAPTNWGPKREGEGGEGRPAEPILIQQHSIFIAAQYSRLVFFTTTRLKTNSFYPFCSKLFFFFKYMNSLLIFSHLFTSLLTHSFCGCLIPNLSWSSLFTHICSLSSSCGPTSHFHFLHFVSFLLFHAFNFVIFTLTFILLFDKTNSVSV